MENSIWLRGNKKFISSVEQDISRSSERSERGISCSTREINFIFPSIHVIFCLFQKHSQRKSKFLLQTNKGSGIGK